MPRRLAISAVRASYFGGSRCGVDDNDVAIVQSVCGDSS